MSPRLAIVGAGAVGCYYGGRLAEAVHDTHFLMRSDYSAVVSQGLRIVSPLGDAHLAVRCSRSSREIGPCDLVLIALKATANAALRDILPPLLKPGTVLLTLQNGLGNEEHLQALCPRHDVMGGLCFVCLNRVAPGVIHHIAQGRISLGEYGREPTPRTHQIAEMFRSAGVDCVVEPSLEAARWKKLVWNIPFNGLSIVTGGLDTERLLANPSLERQVRELMLEVVAAAHALGHSLPDDLVPDMIERTRTMASYKPSSLVDFETGRELELEAIWGEPLRRAAAAGVSMPLTRDLHEQLRDCLRQRSCPAA